MSVVMGLLLAAAAVVALVGGRYLLAYARSEDPREAFKITTEAVTATAGGAFAVGMMGIIELADVVGLFGMFLIDHPFAASNGILAALGAFTSWMGISIGPHTWLGLGIAVPGLVMLFVEVGDD